MSERVRVKICGITRREDALAAERFGAEYLGVVVSKGFGRSVQLATAARLLEGLAPLKVAVMVNEAPHRAGELARALGAEVIQLHGDEPPDVLSELRAMGDWKLWKGVRVRRPADLERIVEGYQALVDAILVEGWKRGAIGGGGAALQLDPDRVRGMIPAGLDLVLAGGLNPSNVAEAIARFEPDVVDVSSGVERSPGKKDLKLMSSFIESAHAASGRAAHG